MDIAVEIRKLIDNGYTPFRKVKWDRVNKVWETTSVRPESINLVYFRTNFNTQIPGGITIFFKKEGEKEAFFGLDVKDDIILAL